MVAPDLIGLPVVFAVTKPREAILHERDVFVLDVNIQLAVTWGSLSSLEELDPKGPGLGASSGLLRLWELHAIFVLHVAGGGRNFNLG